MIDRPTNMSGAPARRWRPSRVVLAATVAGLLASCSTSSVPPGAGSTTTAVTPSTTATTTPTASVLCGVVASPEVTFTSHTEPCAITTHLGVTIHLVLDTGFLWNDPTSDSPAVQVANIERPSAGGGLQADLKAVAVGQATVTSAGGIACPPGQPCPALARLWELHVTVTG